MSIRSRRFSFTVVVASLIAVTSAVWSTWAQEPTPLFESYQDDEMLLSAGWVTVEGFETTSPNTYLSTYYKEAGEYPWNPTGDTLTGLAAHDGNYGLQGQLMGYSPQWLYRNDATTYVQQGDRISVWVKSSGTAGGRAYFGFGAHTAPKGAKKNVAGCYSLTMAENSGEFLLQFSSHFSGVMAVLASVPQTWEADHWYRMEVSWGIGGAIVGRLYDSDGVTLLNTVSAKNTSISSGGIGFRHFEDAAGTSYEFDTVEVLRGGA